MRTITILLSFIIATGLITCIDSYEPAFDEIESLVIIQGQLTDYPGDTRVTVSESVLFLGNYTTRKISNATVKIWSEDGAQAELKESPVELGVYVPEDDFQGKTDGAYHLTVSLPDGRSYKSTSEILPVGVPVDSLSAIFDPEYDFSELRGEFVPGHRILATWQDPDERVNHYQWRYTIYREEIICISCFGGVYRGGDTCEMRDHLPISNQYDYYCSEPCWSITPMYPITIFSDEFVDGQIVHDLEVANVQYESRKSVLVRVHQYSISAEHYRFNKLLSELLVESGGLNSVSPGAIVGNIVNPTDPDEKVLGYFGAAARNDKNLFLYRTNIIEQPTGGIEPQLEPPSPFEDIPRSPCREGPFRTKTKPEGWP